MAAAAPDFLTPAELARRWSLSTATLAEWRRAGKGPRFTQFGGPRTAVRYRLSDIETHERAQKRRGESIRRRLCRSR